MTTKKMLRKFYLSLFVLLGCILIFSGCNNNDDQNYPDQQISQKKPVSRGILPGSIYYLRGVLPPMENGPTQVINMCFFESFSHILAYYNHPMPVGDILLLYFQRTHKDKYDMARIISQGVTIKEIFECLNLFHSLGILQRGDFYNESISMSNSTVYDIIYSNNYAVLGLIPSGGNVAHAVMILGIDRLNWNHVIYYDTIFGKYSDTIIFPNFMGAISIF